jgi:hypothetical protein
LPEEREGIIKYNKKCPFCLLHGAGHVCFAKMSETKPVCLMPEYKCEHIHWLHDILKYKSIINANAVELLEEGAINMVT